MSWYWIAVLLAVPALIVVVVLIVSHLDAFEGDFISTANISCPRCKRETPPRRKVCRHCGHELQ